MLKRSMYEDHHFSLQALGTLCGKSVGVVLAGILSECKISNTPILIEAIEWEC